MVKIMLKINPALYEYVITEFNTYWQPMTQEKIKHNIYNNETDNIQYLGTYFPRSYKEAYVILKDLILFFVKNNYFKHKNLNILDLGSGTGGQLFALLHIIEEEVNTPLNINIFSIDGNQNALDIQKQIYNDIFKHKKRHKIYLYTTLKEFKNNIDIYNFLTTFNNIDILLSFKFLSEMLRYDTNIWYSVLKAGNEILKPNGIICFNDVSMKIEIKDKSYEEFIPIYMNNNVKKYILEDNDSNTLKYIIPFCCANSIMKCPRKNCYSQFSIDVIYIDKNNNLGHYNSLVDYKIFLKNGEIFNNIQKQLKNHNCTDTCIYDKRQCLCIVK